MDIDTELDLLEKERDELVEIIEKLKESNKTKFRIVEKDQVVYAEHMRIENDTVLFECWNEVLYWNIVASCK